MESQKPDVLKEAEELRVPEELLAQLHEADARLHEARRAMEQIMDDSEYDHQRRVNMNGDELKAAERAVEEISQKIHNSLKTAPPDGPKS
jgi:hypothetical protein